MIVIKTSILLEDGDTLPQWVGAMFCLQDISSAYASPDGVGTVIVLMTGEKYQTEMDFIEFSRVWEMKTNRDKGYNYTIHLN